MNSKHRKRKYAFLWALLFLLPLCAAERDCLIVHLQSGDNVVFLLKDSPQIFFTENGAEINLHTYQLSEIKKYTFGDSEHLPEGLSDQIAHELVAMYDGKLFVNMQKGDTRLCIYTIAGQEMRLQNITRTYNKAVVDISGLPAGVYVLGIGSESVKFVKR